MSHTLTLNHTFVTKDTTLQQQFPNNNAGTSAGLSSAQRTTSVSAKTLIQFDISSIPAGAVIVSATLRLYVAISGDATKNNTVHRGLVDWYEGDQANGITTIDGSVWNYRNYIGSVAWSGGAGGAAGTEYVSSATGTFAAGGSGYQSADVTADVQNFYATPANNKGWWIVGQSGATGTKQWASSEHPSSGIRPELVIVYTISETAAPTEASSVSDTVAPTVSAGYLLEPSAAEAVADKSDPTVAIGGETVLGVVSDSVSETSGPDITISALVPAPTPARSRGDTVAPTTVKGSATLSPSPAEAYALSGDPASLVDRTLLPSPATAVGTTVGKGKALRIYPIICTPAPMLHITDGTLKENGQLNYLDLLGKLGFLLNNWNPNIAQYKGGGTWSNSVLADGRTLARRAFDNAIEVMDLKGRGHSQDNMIQFIRELFQWQEQAANFWVSDWATAPVYLVAKAARETEIRYALIHAMSVPELSNPYAQPFFSRNGKASIEGITLRIERGPWSSTPPGEGECVPVSGVRSWTIQGWSESDTSVPDNVITGSVTALVQTTNGDILAGTDTSGRIYRSGDSGQTWLYLSRIGNDPITNVSIRALIKDNAGNLYAAVDGGNAASQGIWKSTNNGVSWTRVKSHPPGTGYLDITAIQGGGKLVAVGHPVGSGAESPVIYSNDRGVTWQNVSTPYWNQKHLSVAAYPDAVLATQYPGEAYGDVFAFFGIDSFYTGMGGVGINPVDYNTFSTVGGGAGNGGLDMISFLIKNPNGSYYRKALWAVKAASDITDTEIWQWPASNTQTSQFAKIATIDSKLFNVMYVDPAFNWQDIGAARTIWAGANGEIYVSYNSGLSWALATNAPVNQIRSILRTTSGVLLAGGDNGEIFVYNGDSGSQGGGTSTDAPAGGSIVVNSHPLGREETCDDEVFASNKSSFNNLTHVLHYNGSTYEELQFASEPPYSILGDTAVVNKAAYFGSKTSDANVPGGTFSNVIYDITQIAENITVVWEYWNGAWTALTVQDISSGFKIAGVGSTHWVIPGDWVTTTVDGIVGYWVRARISVVGSDPVTPIHSNRFIYTANLPYIELGPDAVGGDLPAAAQIRWHNRSDDPDTTLNLEMDRVVCGLKTANRGPSFNAYLNISDKQVPFGITIAKNSVATWGDSTRAPTNRALSISFSSGGDLNAWSDLAVFSLSNTIARDYYGTYRAFVRCYKYGTGSNNWQLRLRTSFGSGGSQAVTKAIFPSTGNDWEVLDFGQISVPTSQVSFLGGNLGDKLEIAVQGYCTATGIGIALYDLILIPTDEWAVDARSPEPSTANAAKIKGNSILDIDSLTNPKVLITATNRTSAELITSRYQAITNGPAMLQAGKQQRLWFLVMSYENYWHGPPEVTGTVTAYKQQRYLGPRGVG